MKAFAVCSSCRKQWKTFLEFHDAERKREVEYKGLMEVVGNQTGCMYTHKTPNCGTTFAVVLNEVQNLSAKGK